MREAEPVTGQVWFERCLFADHSDVAVIAPVDEIIENVDR
jgi:hypothetical protein